jgi:hypothetical protein
MLPAAPVTRTSTTADETANALQYQRVGPLFDVHPHVMPERLMRRVRAYFDEPGPLIARPWPVRYRGRDEERVAQLRGFGVERFTAPARAHRRAWIRAGCRDNATALFSDPATG